ncbi:S1C family serine protease [Clostridium luticellarii]|jgi:serine protease Do|uniref:S1C family serine protease n=1 Tax=Clostridium luticellarii TaxID=1691940 RepID=UPI00235276A4|nr:trypsin-like peptidase domain-containing protein [Clostridium luticellarii]MCI1944600.1 trypsin-like peptidase domain-containing protein [Clostridium luticellarii]MCI1968099.1 trypsin-like peptidase domain-containing protein [Clostridium luticellarii]MCI1994788.1 trypsin-like peptidase domain-containing protein [Clostridium luticellarii]MCI2039020.1 trypsin-like peptidase domain-containing protein [Clostridium luticellarii]
MDDNNRYDNIKDVSWQNVESDRAKIKFINSKRRSNIIKLGKIFCFVLVASISGGISGAYVSSKREAAKIYTPNNNQVVVESRDNADKAGSENAAQNSVSEVAESVSPAVVGISNKAQDYFGLQDLESGSGIIIDSNGYIVTNYHVIQGADKVMVKLSSGKILNASVAGVDERSDLALIKVDAKNLPVVRLGDSSKVKVGDTAIAIGNSLGGEFPGSVTKGIISALNRKIEYNGVIYKVIQTDAAMNPGNSGGPLCNIQGDVIGINSLKLGTDSNIEGIGFAITINEAKDIIKSLMSGEKVSRPDLGISGESVVSQDNKIQGVYIQQVEKNSGASAAGIKPTDILLELDGKKVKDISDVELILDEHKVGDKIKSKIWRDGNVIYSEITLSQIDKK